MNVHILDMGLILHRQIVILFHDYLFLYPRDTSNKENSIFILGVIVMSSLNKIIEDPLLYLHSVPGKATLENVPRYFKSKTWEEIRENHSLIFFDYRGTEYSEPSLCSNIKDSIAASFRKTGLIH